MSVQHIKKQVAKKKAIENAALPQTHHAINNRAMLVGMTVRRWHPLKTDRDISDEVADKYEADHDMGRYHKRLVPKEVTKKMRSIANELRRVHFYLTLPWTDDGRRIVSAKGFFVYREEIKKLIAEYDAGAKEFVELYPVYVEEAKKKRGKMFKLEEYPAVADIAKKFVVELSWEAVPSGDDIRIDIGDDELKNLRQEVDANAKKTIDNAIKDVWLRLKDVISHAAERLKAYSVSADGKVESTFRDSLVTNIQDLLDVVPLLNITDNTDLAAFADDIRTRMLQYQMPGKGKTVVGTVTGELLRDDEMLRSTVAAAADDILKKMEGFLA